MGKVVKHPGGCYTLAVREVARLVHCICTALEKLSWICNDNDPGS